jgi:hypothetical protein
MYLALILLMLLVFFEPAPYERDEGPVWATTADVSARSLAPVTLDSHLPVGMIVRYMLFIDV